MGPGVRDRLTDLGILGTSILWFEQTEDGLTDPAAYRPLSLATLNTHDMHPTAGYLNLADIELSEELGLLDSDPHEVYTGERTNRQDVLKTVAEAGHLEPTDTMVGTIDDVWPVTVGLHSYLSRTAAQLVGVSLADVVGERRTQNKPGTSDEYPNWTLPLTDGSGTPVMLDDLDGGDRLPVIARIMNEAGHDTGEESGGRPATMSADGPRDPQRDPEPTPAVTDTPEDDHER